MIDNALSVIDHIAARVSASAITGIGCGAAFATYKGFPIFKTSASAALSCAMISTACFGMERVAYGILKQSSLLMEEDKPSTANVDSNTDTPSIILQSTTTTRIANPKMHYGSHALGGLFGGSIVGFLFHGKPWAGAALMVPLMLGMGKIEESLDEYRSERLQQLEKDHETLQQILKDDSGDSKGQS